MKRGLHLARFATAAVLVALSLQAAFALPVAFRMAAAAGTICSAAHRTDGADGPAAPAHAHAHCLLCQASAGPPLAAAAPPLPLPGVAQSAARIPGGKLLVVRRVSTGYLSRAPPALA